jgi:hypothetical protein
VDADTINLDDSVDNADWTKQAWDLPPYKSAEFFAVVPLEQLDHFRTLPVYQHAVAAGLIYDDQWVADWVESATDQLADALVDALAHVAHSQKE